MAIEALQTQRPLHGAGAVVGVESEPAARAEQQVSQEEDEHLAEEEQHAVADPLDEHAIQHVGQDSDGDAGEEDPGEMEAHESRVVFRPAEVGDSQAGVAA